MTYYTRLERVEFQESHFIEGPYHHLVRKPDKILLNIMPDTWWIEVSLEEQILYLWQGGLIKEAYRVSTGRPGTPFRISNATRKGTYNIYEMREKYPMWGRDWYCLDVPYVMFFHHDYAIHGAYWHTDFGKVRSHGCTNIAPVDARWLYFWSDPEVPPAWHAVRFQPETTWVYFTN